MVGIYHVHHFKGELKMNIGVAALIIALLCLIILFTGEPDLHDAILYKMGITEILNKGVK